MNVSAAAQDPQSRGIAFTTCRGDTRASIDDVAGFQSRSIGSLIVYHPFLTKFGDCVFITFLDKLFVGHCPIKP